MSLLCRSFPLRLSFQVPWDEQITSERATQASSSGRKPDQLGKRGEIKKVNLFKTLQTGKGEGSRLRLRPRSNYIYGGDGRRQEVARRRASRNLRRQTGLISAGNLRRRTHAQPTQPAALPCIVHGKYMAAGGKWRNQTNGWPDSLLASRRRLDQEGISAVLRALLVSSGRPAATSHATQPTELLCVGVFIL